MSIQQGRLCPLRERLKPTTGRCPDTCVRIVNAITTTMLTAHFHEVRTLCLLIEIGFMNLRNFLTAIGLLTAVTATAQCEYTEVTFTTSTSLYPWEMGWELYHIGETDTSQILSFSGSIEGTFAQTACLEDGCYFFLATDSWVTDGTGARSLQMQTWLALSLI